MSLIRKQAVAKTPKVKVAGEAKERSSVDLAFTSVTKSQVTRESFKFSPKKFAEMNLDVYSLGFDQSEANGIVAIVTTEGSSLSEFFGKLKVGAKVKAHTFSSPELVEVFTQVPAERESGFKAVFTVTKATDAVIEDITARLHDEFGEAVKDIITMFVVEHKENTSFAPRTRKAKDDVVAVAPDEDSTDEVDEDETVEQLPVYNVDADEFSV